MYDFAYARALEAVAMGATRDETRAFLQEQAPSLSDATASRAMSDALTDALRQGVERDDIDPSWYGQLP